MNNWTPAVTIETHAGTKEIGLYSELLSNRNIFIQGDIDKDMANEFLIQLMYLTRESDEEVNIYISSKGGEVNAGLVIYDLIQSSRVPINVYAVGMAASMAALLLAGGEKGRRFILPHSKVMIHEPLLAGGVGGSASSIRNISESIMRTRDMLNEIMAKHTGKTVEEIEAATAYDNYMTAEEAVEFGICDEVRDKVF